MEGGKRVPGGAESLGPVPDELAAGALVLVVGQCDICRVRRAHRRAPQAGVRVPNE